MPVAAVRRRLAALTIALVALAAHPAIAAPVDDAAREAARRLGYEGIGAYESGDYEVALEKLDRAYAIVRVPTLGLWSARALVRRRRLVRAAERYLEVVRSSLGEGDAVVQAQAKETAARERAALMPRIPQVTLLVRGPEPKEVVATLDGARLATGMLGVTFGVDPGEHTIEVRGAAIVRRVIRVGEGEARVVEFDLPKGPLLPPGPDPAWIQRAQAARATRLRASAGLAIAGGLGLGTGAVLGLLASAANNDAHAACPRSPVCPDDSAHDKSQQARSLAEVANVAFAVGGGALAGAAVLWLEAPRVPRPDVAVVVGPGAASFRVAF